MNPLDPFGSDDGLPDEPEEFDPDSLGPDPPDPAANVEGSVGDVEDVDEELVRAFWGAVFFLNVTLAALAIGAMLVVFRGDWSTGGPTMLVGVVAALFTWRYYREGRTAGDTSANDDAGEEANP